MKKKMVLGFIIFLVVGGGIYMLKEQQLKQERNMAVKNIQKKASNYIIENYEGINKIEWRGWSISVPFSVDTSMIINDYPMDENYEGLFSYSANGEKYIKKYTDVQIAVTPFSEGKDNMDKMQKTLRKQGVKKSVKGSPNAEIIYNWEESK